MGRIDAHPQRLHPQIATSVLSTPEESTRIPFSTITDAVLHALQQDTYVLPPQKKIPRPFGIGRPVVVLATGNGIREEDFKHKIPDAKLRRIPFEEAPTADTLRAAQSKANSAAAYENEHRSWRHPLWKLREVRRQGLWKAAITVGLDAVNAIPQIQPDGSVVFIQLGKPERESSGEELETIRNRFANLAQVARENDWPAVPMIIEMSQALRNTFRRGRDGRYDAHSTKRTVVMLDPEVLAYLATPEGFLKYMQVSLESKPPLIQTAGGIKHEALGKLGAILFISDSPKEITSMQFDHLDQERQTKLAERLAKGKLHPDLMNAYIAKL